MAFRGVDCLLRHSHRSHRSLRGVVLAPPPGVPCAQRGHREHEIRAAKLEAVLPSRELKGGYVTETAKTKIKICMYNAGGADNPRVAVTISGGASTMSFEAYQVTLGYGRDTEDIVLGSSDLSKIIHLSELVQLLRKLGIL